MTAIIRKNVPLKNFTTFRIGGKARYFCIAKSKNDFMEALTLAREKSLPFFILGNGSNLLVSDAGFNGLVVKIQNTKCQIRDTEILVDAGYPLGRLLNIALKSNLSGLEWAAGVPGTLGGAIYGNAGTRDESISSSVKEVEFFDSKKMKIGKFKKGECRFAYRDSVFKHEKNLIITSILLRLKKKNRTQIIKAIGNNLSGRKEKQPLNMPSAGSIFKNPNGFFAANLIEGCGLKGERIGRVEISRKHANFIVNLGGGKAKDVVGLINLAKRSVKNKFGVNLEEEIQYLGL